MRKLLKCFLLLLIASNVNARSNSGFDSDYQLQRSGSYVQDKNFYLLTLLQEVSEFSVVLNEDDAFREVHRKKVADLLQASTGCKKNIQCHADTFTWDVKEIEEIALSFEKLYHDQQQLHHLVTQHLRPSGRFQAWHSLSDVELLKAAWRDTARGMNNIIQIYALGVPPRYGSIDSMSYEASSHDYQRLINTSTYVINENADQPSHFFEPSLRFVLQLLDINGRDEAGRFEPMETLENEEALQFIAKIKWEKYPYSHILVPGRGPELERVALDPYGKLHLAMAVKRYRQGLAPLLLVSGGAVHPKRTPYNEALEMKKELMNGYGIPARAIIVEPHARHTTTNFRNAARLVYRYGIPADKKALFTTNEYQAGDVVKKAFDDRCMEELGYLPYTLYEQLSPVDVEFIPRIESLHANPIDPLDP